MEYYTILTEAGLALEAAALAGEKSFALSACALGDGAGEPDPKATALKNEVWRGPLHSVSRDEANPNWLVLEAHVPVEEGGFIIREFGVYTDDGVLFAIGNHPETYKPTMQQGTGIEMIIRPICAVSNEASVTLLVDPSIVMASRQYVDDKVAKCVASGIPTGRAIYTTAPLTGGGDLSADRTLSIAKATEETLGVVQRATDAEAAAGTDREHYVTPRHLKQLFDDLALDGGSFLDESGWQRLPSGLLFQWGRTGPVNKLQNVTVTYPVAFNAVYSIHTTAYVGVNSTYSVANVVTWTTTEAVLRNSDNNTNYPYIFWSAIGQ